MVRSSHSKESHNIANSSSEAMPNDVNNSQKMHMPVQKYDQSKASNNSANAQTSAVYSQNYSDSSAYYYAQQAPQPVFNSPLPPNCQPAMPMYYAQAPQAPQVTPQQVPQQAQLRTMPVQSPMQVSQPTSVILLGTYTPKIDSKGRVALPAKFRAQLGTGFVMARGQERCVYVLPMQEFQRITSQIQHTSMSNKSARDYLRVFLSGAVDQEPDKQGRIVVPPMLREYANLEDEIVVIGVGTRAEIWNKTAWNEYLADREQGYADIADDVLPVVM